MENPYATIIGTVFGEVLQRYRNKLGLSQEELAFRAGVDRTFVSRIERGIRQPTITTLIGLALALDVSAAELMKEVEKGCECRLKEIGTK